ncbi:hypothetical protein [Leptospira vanthielii]|uniref:DUF4365 domain-containing protein n=1 Tax=Leptospira vanthielii serovar Holland str. Waz Holland = ATCC 700522 TaxID=1218591 RepID=N1VVE9_9LEPT|nr:hypothetical protein [Leptospira vanthielii]EMY67949.1 hypothetical protein LEP1GSC199_3768 [Leptospira vanthielii serovar Holland str. Waz Holland = ATCC 700522]
MSEEAVTFLNHFLIDSPILKTFLKENDKTPVFDGSILLYQGNKNSNSNIMGSISVQVKGEEKTKKSKPSHSISMLELDIYKKEGGVLFIKVIYENKFKFEIFARNLLPLDILKIKGDAKKDVKTVTVQLDRINSLQHFELLCDNYLKHKKYQMDSDHFLYDLPKVMTGSERILVQSTLTRGENPISAFFSKNCYVYLEEKQGNRIPVLIQFSEVIHETDIQVSVNGKNFFNIIQWGMNSKKEKFLALNSILNLFQKENKLEFQLSKKLVTDFTEIFEAFLFLKSVRENGELSINNQTFPVNASRPNETIDSDIQILKEIKKIIDYFRLGKVRTSLTAIDNDYEKIEILNKYIFNDNGDAIKSAPDYFIQKYSFLGQKVIIFAHRIHNRNYKITNFFNELPETLDLFRIRIETEEFPCSRFLALNDNLVQYISQDFEQVTSDLKSKFISKIYTHYQNFALRCILVYDKVKDPRFLVLAFKILRFKKKSDFLEEERVIKLINLFQIIKRVRKLKHSEYSLIQKLKQNNQNTSLICCCLILLESFREFDLEFSKLSDSDKDFFMKWPIYTLRNQETKQ